MLSASEIAAKWKKNAQGAGDAFAKGVQSVTSSPMMKAAAKKDEWLRGIQRAADDGSWEEGLASVTLEGWKERTATTGMRRYVDGTKDGEGKVAAFMQQWLPVAGRISTEVKAMPKGSLSDSIARATKAIEMASQFRFKKPKS